MEDKLLIHRCKRGDGDALCKIYEKYKSYLLAIAVSLVGDVNSAEDVVHDVFVNFARKIGSLHLRKSLKSYLARCVVNRVRDLYKSKKGSEVSLDFANQTSSNATAADERIICNEEMQQLAGAMSKLDSQQREVVVLRLYSEMKFGEIAEMQNESVNTIKSRYRYGMNKLRSMLNGEVEK